MTDPFADLDWTLVKRLQAADREQADARHALSDAILALSPFQKGDIVRETNTGARYRVESGHGYLNSGRPTYAFNGTRVYATGRREARSITHLLSPRYFEKVTDE